MNRTLTDFLNHGLLPFVGRAREIERLTAFWRGFSDATGLREARLIGEAGVGKSRLIEEFLPRIARDGGLAVHIRLHPESIASIASPLARALWYSDFGAHLLMQEPEETLPSVTAALRRLARLRPMLIVIEDTHLLTEGSVGDLATLLAALADESVSVLSVARPVELPARAILQRYLVEEIRLEGLGPKGIGDLWCRLFDADPGSGVVDRLGSFTAGNALALRSSLRSALASGAIALAATGEYWSVSEETFTRVLRQDVDLVSRGMAAHLTAPEGAAAARLACLGEVFSHEAAAAVLDDSERWIGTLLFKGILATSTATPLAGSESDTDPLAFTHTLVHRSFAGQGEVETERLARLLLAQVPLYTILPIELLAEGRLDGALPVDEQEQVLVRLRELAWRLRTGLDWELGQSVWKVYIRMFEQLAPGLDSDMLRKMRRAIPLDELGIYQAELETDGYRRRIARALEATANPVTTQDAEFRLHVLYYVLDGALTLSDMEKGGAVIEEAERVAAEFPDARLGYRYLLILSARARGAMMMRNREMLRAVERSVQQIAWRRAEDPEFHETLVSHVDPYLLLLFDTREELKQRKEQLAALEADPASAHSFFETMRVEFLFEQGEIHPMLRAADVAMTRARAEGVRANLNVVQMHRLPGRVAVGLPLADIRAEAAAIIAQTEEPFRERQGWLFWEKLAVVGWLRGESEWVAEMHDEMVHGAFREKGSPELRLMLALTRGESPRPSTAEAGTIGEGTSMVIASPDSEIGVNSAKQSRTSAESREIASSRTPRDDQRALSELVDIASEQNQTPDLEALARAVAADSSDPTRIAEAARSLLAMPMLRFLDLLRQRTVILLIERGGRAAESAARELGKDFHEALLRALRWLDERRLPLLMRPILADFAAYLPAKESRAWEMRVTELVETMESERLEGEEGRRVTLSMLGTIEARIPEREPWRPKGARIRVLLGLLVANEMLEEPLTHQEFCAIASGITGEHEAARRATNVAVFRLRESLGHEAIDTGEATPRLDRQRVGVDLLRAHELMQDAAAALRGGLLSRAVPALLEAMEILHGEVPFPALYEDFFEAARGDLDERLRTTAVRIARSLLREGDAANAETILRGALESMPEDEELAEILCDALTRQGKRTEAERVRRRGEGAMRREGDEARGR